MIALTLFDRRTGESFTVVASPNWRPDAAIYVVTRSVSLPDGWRNPR